MGVWGDGGNVQGLGGGVPEHGADVLNVLCSYPRDMQACRHEHMSMAANHAGVVCRGACRLAPLLLQGSGNGQQQRGEQTVLELVAEPRVAPSVCPRCCPHLSGH
jgi:hypothetical protein